jgi:hypothetical protein
VARRKSCWQQLYSVFCFRDLSYDQYRLLLALSIILEVASLLVQGQCISTCVHSGITRTHEESTKFTLCSVEACILFILIIMISLLLWKPKKRWSIMSCAFCLFVVIISALEIILKAEVLKVKTKFDFGWDIVEAVICLLHVFPAIVCYRSDLSTEAPVTS